MSKKLYVNWLYNNVWTWTDHEDYACVRMGCVGVYMPLFVARVISKGQSGRAGTHITVPTVHGHAEEVGLGRLGWWHTSLAAIASYAAVHCVVAAEAEWQSAPPPCCEVACTLMHNAWGLGSEGFPNSLDWWPPAVAVVASFVAAPSARGQLWVACLYLCLVRGLCNLDSLFTGVCTVFRGSYLRFFFHRSASAELSGSGHGFAVRARGGF